MGLIPLELESRLRGRGLWPESRVAWAAIYVLALDLFLFAVQLLSSRVWPGVSTSFSGWITFLDILAIVLLAILAIRWLRAKLLWRLRNRLIVTYVFIGVIPAFLLAMISLITLYLLAGQFAGFIVTSEVDSHLRSMESSGRAIAHHLANRLAQGGALNDEEMATLRPQHQDWSRRQVCVWYKTPQPRCASPSGMAPPENPGFDLRDDFREIVRDRGKLYLRTASIVTGRDNLRVVSSESLDKSFMERIAAVLGELTLFELVPVAEKAADTSGKVQEPEKQRSIILTSTSVSADGRRLEPTFTAGTIPLANGSFDHEITFGTPLTVVDWSSSGERHQAGALVRIQTRPSVLYTHLFAALGDFAQGAEYILLFSAIILGIIEVLALWIGTRLTRTITSSVAQLYEGTTHVNRGDFSHRIVVKSQDQLATLADSFNSMTASIERLIEEQKEKQRLENELSIAQEVQAQLFPKEISQLESLEVHGFCRPARTVSGDYYDFLTLNSEKMILAVGDISGKGISAALLMATIHSAVRAYSIEGIPLLREPVSVGASAGHDMILASDAPAAEASPATLLALLNHQLYQSTPEAKYATLFLGFYDGVSRRLTYANGGHLPPIVISEDGTARLLGCGGTVVGLLDNVDFPEASVDLRPGELLVAYSDGVTEPENDYGEFGEERLIQIVRENRHLPLPRITEIVTAAVDDWIGDNEQPDDVTIVLARAR